MNKNLQPMRSKSHAISHDSGKRLRQISAIEKSSAYVHRAQTDRTKTWFYQRCKCRAKLDMDKGVGVHRTFASAQTAKVLTRCRDRLLVLKHPKSRNTAFMCAAEYKRPKQTGYKIEV